MTLPRSQVDGLRVELEGEGIDIVDEVSFRVDAGEVLGLVGESGSGKTTVGLAVLGHTRRGARVTDGAVRHRGAQHPRPRLRCERQSLRGKLVSYVPQDPAAALNPALRIGKQLSETLSEHGFGASDEERRARIRRGARRGAASVATTPFSPAIPTSSRAASSSASRSRWPSPTGRGSSSSTSRRRASTSRRRRTCSTTVRDLCGAHGVAALYVSHDLAVVATLCRRVAVMYAGRIVEIGPKSVLFRASAHPYARRLVEAIPELSGRARARRDSRFRAATRASPGGLLLRAALLLRRRIGAGPSSRRSTARRRRARGALLRSTTHVLADSLAARTAAVVTPEVPDGDALVAVARRRRVARPTAGPLRRGRRRPSARVRRARRRVGLGQDDARTLHRGAAHELRGRDHVSRAPAATRRARARPRDATGDPVRLPEPVHLAQPAQDDRPDHRAALQPVLRSRGPGDAEPRRCRRSRRSSSARRSSSDTRTISRAASASASPSRVRSWPARSS